jgi:hypothetical protein
MTERRKMRSGRQKKTGTGRQEEEDQVDRKTGMRSDMVRIRGTVTFFLPSFLPISSFHSVPSFQFPPVPSFQFPPFNSFLPTPSFQLLASFLPIPSFLQVGGDGVGTRYKRSDVLGKKGRMC